MSTVCRGCGLPVHNTETCSQAKRKADLQRDVETVSSPEAAKFIAESGGIVMPAGPPTVIELPIEEPKRSFLPPVENISPTPLPNGEKIANVANQEEYRPPSLRRYKDIDKRRKYMKDLMAKRRAAAKATKKGKK